MSLGSGTFVALLMWLVATPWSRAWQVPEAAPLVRIIALTLFLTLRNRPARAPAPANSFRAAATVETGAQVTGVTVGVYLAFEMHSALALVIGQTVAAGTLLVAAVWLTRREVRVSFALSEVKELFSFAGQVSILNLVFFTLYTAPSWAIARLFGAHALGLYSRANLIVGFPLTTSRQG